VAELVATLTGEVRGIGVAVNRELVPRGRWHGTALADGDRVELGRAAQGGC
jgi:sulfur carrier protein